MWWWRISHAVVHHCSVASSKRVSWFGQTQQQFVQSVSCKCHAGRRTLADGARMKKAKHFSNCCSSCFIAVASIRHSHCCLCACKAHRWNEARLSYERGRSRPTMHCASSRRRAAMVCATHGAPKQAINIVVGRFTRVCGEQYVTDTISVKH